MVMVLSPIKKHIQLALRHGLLLVGDFNNDTHLDIVVVNSGLTTIYEVFFLDMVMVLSPIKQHIQLAIIHRLLLWVISITTLIWISLLPIIMTKI